MASDLISSKERTFHNAIRALNKEIIKLANMQSGRIGFIDFDKNDVTKALKNGTLAIGFIGIWDAISILHKDDINTPHKLNKLFSCADGVKSLPFWLKTS